MTFFPCKVRVPHIEIFQGASVSDEAETYVLLRIRQWLEDTKQAGIIFANVDLPPQLDLVVFTHQAAIVVEVKAWRAQVRGQINGPWMHVRPGGDTKALGNAYRQTVGQNQALRDAFRTVAVSPPSYPRGILVFRHGLWADSNVEECSDYRVHVCRMENFEAALRNARTRPWAFDDVRSLAIALNLSRADDAPPRATENSRNLRVVGTMVPNSSAHATPRPDDRTRSSPPATECDASPSVSASRLTSTRVAQDALPRAKADKGRQARRLTAIAIVLLVAAAGMAISHKPGRATDTGDGSAPSARQEPDGSSAHATPERRSHPRRATRHHEKPHTATPIARTTHDAAEPSAPVASPREGNEPDAATPSSVCPEGVDRLGCPSVLVDPARTAP
ncbi:NERD domain-containing protein [Robbsia sp. Bb-Pol-6]|uniref:NERD domain-containing protein n=1 Tax=Robbsia betulipollinis TaxID=2981849 RepID=A0ABT3ZH20_9BURK|nr:NERD domain-containing protein [Robbsia betulipollinis]MCY0385825.1 NERD domain-containing protein [Robbsia betulipollinis]